MPAPLKLTTALIDEVVNLVRSGLDPDDALMSKGVTDRTARRWRQRASERPDSIYGDYLYRVGQAVGEASAIDVAVITNAATAPARTTTTVTKRERSGTGDTAAMVVTEETVKVVEHPPQWKAAAWKLERRNAKFRPSTTVEAKVTHLPPDMLDRTMGELLRLANEDDRPSLLRPDDEEARALLPSS